MGDCERFHDGLVAEPVNALSSVAYIAAGAYVWRHNRPAGAALVAVGIGSLASHGPGGTLAQVLHNGAIVVLVGIVVVALPRIARGFRARPAMGALAIGAFAIALSLQAFGRTGGAWCRPDSLLQAHAGWHALTALALVLAFVGAARLSRNPSGVRQPPPTTFEPANR